MTITKQFTTLKQAESYLQKLYGTYNIVMLIDCPRFTESGTYVFHVN